MIQLFTLILAANESREVALSGEYFELRNAIEDVSLVELLDRSGGVISRLSGLQQSDFVRPGQFETVRVTNGATAQTLRFFVGSGDAGSRRFSGEVTVLGDVTLAAEHAATFENSAAIAVTAVETPLATARTQRRSIRFTNIGADPVAIGATGITWARRCIILNPGDTWLEDSAAGLAWAAICDAGKTASITAQEVMA